MIKSLQNLLFGLYLFHSHPRGWGGEVTTLGYTSGCNFTPPPPRVTVKKIQPSSALCNLYYNGIMIKQLVFKNRSYTIFPGTVPKETALLNRQNSLEIP